jgi:hypothetical protein
MKIELPEIILRTSGIILRTARIIFGIPKMKIELHEVILRSPEIILYIPEINSDILDEDLKKPLKGQIHAPNRLVIWE